MEILRTDRLRLRWFTLDDAPFVMELLNDPGWQQNISDPGIRDLEAARRWTQERLIDIYWAQGHGFWLVERLADGEPLGLCGIFKRPSLSEPDVGYALLGRHAGQGYAREAASACLRYAREVLGLRCVQAITAAHNERSAHLLHAIGLRDLGLRKIDGYDEPERLFEWRDEAAPALSDAQQIDALIARFYQLFDNRAGRTPLLPILPMLMLPGAQLHRADASGLHSMDLKAFVEPRAELLRGRLVDFHEWETEAQTHQQGGIAQRWSHYSKSGQMDGQPYGGQGLKTFQLLRTTRGWRISSVGWQDD